MTEYTEREESTITSLNGDNCVNPAKIKTSFAQIIVSGTVDKPYYEILYLDTSDGGCHIGFGSYCIEYVFKWLTEEFEIIETEPAADVAPVFHARWTGNYNSHCSCCGEFCTGAYIKEYPNYCPNCGAKMNMEKI